MQLQVVQDRIYRVRNKSVMLDFDLADLYSVETRVLKQAVRRNMDRFPEDFMFELTFDEYQSLRSQFVTLKEDGRGKHSKYKPFAFTQEGVAMLSSVLRSKKAVEVNIAIMRAFVFTREYALSHEDLTQKLQALEEKCDKRFKDIHQVLDYLLEKDRAKENYDNRSLIGFKTDKKKDS